MRIILPMLFISILACKTPSETNNLAASQQNSDTALIDLGKEIRKDTMVAGDLTHPSIRKDGRILYVAKLNKTGSINSRTLFQFNPVSGQNELLINNVKFPGDNKNINLISPQEIDEHRIAFLADNNKEGIFNLFVYDTAAKKSTAITSHGLKRNDLIFIEEFHISPDNNYIVFKNVSNTKHHFQSFGVLNLSNLSTDFNGDYGHLRWFNRRKNDTDFSHINSFTLLNDGKVAYFFRKNRKLDDELWIYYDDDRAHKKINLNGTQMSFRTNLTAINKDTFIFANMYRSENVTKANVLTINENNKTAEVSHLYHLYDFPEQGEHPNVNFKSPQVLADGRILFSSNRNKDRLYNLWIFDPKKASRE